MEFPPCTWQRTLAPDRPAGRELPCCGPSATAALSWVGWALPSSKPFDIPSGNFLHVETAAKQGTFSIPANIYYFSFERCVYVCVCVCLCAGTLGQEGSSSPCGSESLMVAQIPHLWPLAIQIVLTLGNNSRGLNPTGHLLLDHLFLKSVNRGRQVVW